MKRNPQINTEPKTPLQLLQDAVAARIRWWEALSALENATATDGEYSNRTHDAVVGEVDSLAAGLGAADDAHARVNEAHLQKVLSHSGV